MVVEVDNYSFFLLVEQHADTTLNSISSAPTMAYATKTPARPLSVSNFQSARSTPPLANKTTVSQTLPTKPIPIHAMAVNSLSQNPDI